MLSQWYPGVLSKPIFENNLPTGIIRQIHTCSVFSRNIFVSKSQFKSLNLHLQAINSFPNCIETYETTRF